VGFGDIRWTSTSPHAIWVNGTCGEAKDYQNSHGSTPPDMDGAALFFNQPNQAWMGFWCMDPNQLVNVVCVPSGGPVPGLPDPLTD
jgi:hypothetical protein